MFAMSVRVSPCAERCSLASPLRSTRTLPSSTVTSTTRARIAWCNSPFGPLTRTPSFSSVTFTPDGTTTGSLPIRDITIPLPNVGQDFAADAGLFGALARHDALRRRNDDEPEAAEHARNLRLARVYAQARPRNAAQPGNDLLFFRSVLERDANRALRSFGQALEALDEAFVHENPCDRRFGSRRGHVNRFVVGGIGVANPRQHVG